MGSGFSACTGPASVGVTDITTTKDKHALNHSGGGVHSDSCDSGISINEGHRKSKTSRHNNNYNNNNNAASRHPDPDPDSEDESGGLAMVAGTDVACGTADFLMTSTPRRPAAAVVVGPGGRMKLDDVAEHPGGGGSPTTNAGALSPNGTPVKAGRPLHARPHTKSLRHNPNSSPNLLAEHAIHEEDEEANEGEPEDKRLRPARPKSAHFRKSRAGQTSHRGANNKSRSQKQRHLNSAGSVSGGEENEGDSPAEGVTSEEEGEDDFDSDVLSIPDETSCGNTLTTVRLGPQFHAKTRIHDNNNSNNTTTNNNNNSKQPPASNDDMDWWADDLVDRTKQDDNGRGSSFRSQASSTLTVRSSSRVWPEGRVAKKASERSISSILLTSAVELDASSPSAAASAAAATTNPACFAVTNPEITQHILKVSPCAAAQAQQATTIATCMRNVINATAATAECVAGANEQASRDFFQNFTSPANQNALSQKLHHIFRVKPAPTPPPPSEDRAKTSPEEELEKKLRDMFMVKDVEGEKTADERLNQKLAELDAASSEDSDNGNRSSRNRHHRHDYDRRQSLVIGSGIADNLAQCNNQTRVLKSVLVTSRSESAINLVDDPESKLKKRVSFSPDIPDVYKCSKTYRMRRIASIARRLRKANMVTPMRPVGHGQVNIAVPSHAAVKTRPNILTPVKAVSKTHTKVVVNKPPLNQCQLCRKDCIKRLLI